MKRELLTHSRMESFKVCRRKHFYSYELGLRPIEEGRALRMGDAFHGGIAALDKGIDAACHAVRARYADLPDGYDAYDWAIECETVLRLVCGYEWRWRDHPLTQVATERAFCLPLLNPKTNAASTVWDEAGKIDGIVKLEDGRLAVKEMKTVSEDIGLESPLWRRLRIDQQISLYVNASRRLGYQVSAVLYDVTRKPTISAREVPVTDADGMKIVLDRDGNRVRTKTGSWRQTSDTELGFTLQTRPMTPDEWGDRLTEDICARPHFYFARVEVARLDRDLEEFAAEKWEIQQAIREAHRTGRHYRTVSRHTCAYCSYFDLCSGSMQLQAIAPPGFEFVSNIHPELGDINADTTNSPSAASSTAETGTEAATASV